MDAPKVRPKGASQGWRASNRHGGRLGPPVYLSVVPGTAQAGGEFLTFDLPAPSEARQTGAPKTRLPAIDRLEGFHPGGSCLYRRVLAPVWAAGAVFPAWLYVGEDSTMIRSTPTGRPSWP